MAELTHFNDQQRARMVDVTEKPVTFRQASAEGFISMNAETLSLVREGRIKKGDVLAVAQVAGILAAKRAHELIPMCHPIALTGVDLRFEMRDAGIEISAQTRCKGETGVEMEALTAVSAAALTIYDMCKAVQRDMRIGDIHLSRKEGGKSGLYEAPSGRVVSVNLSERKGTVKHEVESLALRKGMGAVGDAHAGNWHRQVSLLAQESVETMRAAVPVELTSGIFAENIDTEGLNLKTLPVGTRLRVGGALLAVTQIGKECHGDGCAIKKAAGRCVMPTEGIFAIVLQDGTVRKGDVITVLP